ncbi:NYN domain-containing protein [Yoonia sp. R2331]|uniref:NYN domain-containing protein n=1 Tax=Yoonia sp. R2331 TaxID=3237238 RepID=UPI0034E49170
MAQNERMLLAVLIDADNIPAKHASAILKEITRYGEPALRRVYGDWSSSNLNGWRKVVLELGLVANQETANTVGKNASDIGLVIDAMDILHKGRFDGFVLVSSDSDFTALANRLREDGVDVIGIGESKAPVSLRNVCNRFILIENLIEAGKDVDKSAPKASAKMSGKKPAKDVIPLVLKAMNNIDADAVSYSLGQLGQYITRSNPDFDPRTFGSAKLSSLLIETKRFTVTKDPNGNHLTVQRLD